MTGVLRLIGLGIVAPIALFVFIQLVALVGWLVNTIVTLAVLAVLAYIGYLLVTTVLK